MHNVSMNGGSNLLLKEFMVYFLLNAHPNLGLPQSPLKVLLRYSKGVRQEERDLAPERSQ